MNPLSVFNYYRRNKLRLLPVLLVLALAVFGISLTGVLTGSIQDSAQQKVEVYRGAAQISPGQVRGRGMIDPTIRGDIARDDNLQGLFPDIRLSTYMPTLAGQTSTHIYAVNVEAFPMMLERFELALASGTLPQLDSNQVALHETVAKSRGLALGDYLDPEKDDQEYLAGKLRIVGLLRGPTVLSLASLEYVSRRSEFRGIARSLLAIPKPNEQAALENDLNQFNPDLVRTFTYGAELARFRKDFASMDAIAWSINSVIVVVLSLLAGLLNMIYFLDRMNEFGLLLGIGYARAFVLRRALIESLVLTVLAWGLGILFSQAVYTLLNAFIFAPRGMSLSVLNWHAIQFTLPIPLMVGLFSAGTVIWQLRNFDPISIIERRD